MRTLFAVAFCISASALAATPPPIDEDVVAALIKDGISESQVRAGYNSCDNGGPISMKICFRYRLEKETMKLSGTYGELRDSLLKHSAANAKALEQAQDAWSKYQYQHCSLEGGLGSFDYGTEMLACQWKLAQLRTNTLAEMLSRWNSVDR